MHLSRAKRRSKKYWKSECTIYRRGIEQDIYGSMVEPNDEDIVYSGKCFVSPGNMWPFENGEAPIRTGRADVIFYVPTSVVVDSTGEIRYDTNRYQIIGYAPVNTADASIAITARRVT